MPEVFYDEYLRLEELSDTRHEYLEGEIRADALHIAVATVNAMDFLLSWNCTHIANAEMYASIKAACQERGFECPVICTPDELLAE